MKKTVTADQSVRYRNFIKSRDYALEQMLYNSQREQTDRLRAYLKTVSHAADIFAAQVVAEKKNIIRIANTFKQQITHQKSLDLLAMTLGTIAKNLRRRSFMLALAGEAEAIGQATGKKTHYDPNYQELEKFLSQDSVSGGAITTRTMMYLHRMIDKFHQVFIQQALSGQHKTAQSLHDAIMLKGSPPEKEINNPKHVLKRPVREMSFDDVVNPNDDKTDMSVGFFTNSDWDDIVDAYRRTYDLETRSPTAKVRGIDDDENVVYEWEFERDLTEEMVNSVRAGTMEAAEQNDVDDFVWIAVIDNRTDECCLWRDGLLVSEIEKELGGQHSDDECQTSVPPAHFNCRCRVAPVLQSIQDQSSKDDVKEFQEWLDS